MGILQVFDWKTSLCVSGSILCGLAFKLLKTNVFRKIDKYDINKVLFYGAEDKTRMREVGLDNLYCINYVLAHANETIDVCVPSLESDNIAKCLINVQQRNRTEIRVAVHKSDNGHNLQCFAKIGIQVKVIKSTERLEHEFMLVDANAEANKAVAIIGSLDYQCRVNCNWDATLVTSEVAVIKTLKKEFERVWNSVQ